MKPFVKTYGERVKVVMKQEVLSIKIGMEQSYIVIIIPLIIFSIPLFDFAEWPMLLGMGLIVFALFLEYSRTKSIAIDVQNNSIKIQQQFFGNAIRLKPRYYSLNEVFFKMEKANQEKSQPWNSIYLYYRSERKKLIFFVGDGKAMLEFLRRVEDFYPNLKIKN